MGKESSVATWPAWSVERAPWRFWDGAVQLRQAINEPAVFLSAGFLALGIQSQRALVLYGVMNRLCYVTVNSTRFDRCILS